MHKIPVGLKKVATLCVLRHQDKFLLLKRAKMPNQGDYTPVGGKLDAFETPYECAIRETLEETAIALSSLRYCGILTESSPTKYNWISYVYIADIDYIPPPACNEGTLKWIAADELLNVPTPKTDWYIYQYILQNKAFAFSATYNKALELNSMVEEIENKQLI